MSTGTDRWGPPAAASVAVLAVITSLWALRDASVGGPGPDLVVPEPTPAPATTTRPPEPVPARARVVLDSYTVHGQRLTVRYTIGLRRCSSRIDKPVVVESVEAVTVTLRRFPVRRSQVQGCPNISLADAVAVTLSAPLGGREVRDGGRGGVPVPREPSASSDGDPLPIQ
jgi:hypothetical protein